MALEFDININTFVMLCDIAHSLNMKRIHTSDGCIITDKYAIDFTTGDETDKTVIIDSQMTKDMINRYSQAIYQSLSSEKIYWNLHINKWKTKDNLKMFSIDDVIVFLTVNDCQLGFIPEELTVYKSLDKLMNGEKYGHIDCNCDSFGVDMKCIYVMLAGLSCDIIYDYFDNNIYQQFMIDVRELADKFNPEIM